MATSDDELRARIRAMQGPRESPKERAAREAKEAEAARKKAVADEKKTAAAAKKAVADAEKKAAADARKAKADAKKAEAEAKKAEAKARKAEGKTSRTAPKFAASDVLPDLKLPHYRVVAKFPGLRKGTRDEVFRFWSGAIKAGAAEGGEPIAVRMSGREQAMKAAVKLLAMNPIQVTITDSASGQAWIATPQKGDARRLVLTPKLDKAGEAVGKTPSAYEVRKVERGTPTKAGGWSKRWAVFRKEEEAKAEVEKMKALGWSATIKPVFDLKIRSWEVWTADQNGGMTLVARYRTLDDAEGRARALRRNFATVRVLPSDQKA